MFAPQVSRLPQSGRKQIEAAPASDSLGCQREEKIPPADLTQGGGAMQNLENKKASL